MKENTIFKKCPKCGVEWDSRDEFLQDDSAEIVGYQADFTKLMPGIFLFNHSCKTTLAIKVGDMEDLYDGPIFKKQDTSNEECQKNCLYPDDLSPCSQGEKCSKRCSEKQLKKGKNG